MAEPIVATGLIRIHPAPGGAVAALRGLDLHVDAGEIATVVGPSGSGKSTLLRILAGIDRPTAGRLSVFGQDLTTATPLALDAYRRDTVGLVEQHYRRALSPYRRVGAAIELPLALRGQAPAGRRARVAGLLERIGLLERADAWPHELSGGEQQRVAFAVALAPRPRLLLADEPTGELDGASAEELFALIRGLVRDEGATGIVVTHDPRFERYADRVVHVADGRVVAHRAGAAGTATIRASDSLGWHAPDLAAEPGAVPPPERRRQAGDAVVLDAVERQFGPVPVHRAGSLGLAAVTARFARGGAHVITGPSGSGKTTLLRCITGLDRPTSGRVVTLGRDLGAVSREDLSDFRTRHIGLVDQLRDLVPFLSALENVELGLAIRGQRGPEARDRAMAAIQRVGLGRLADRAPEGLSAGERLRVAIARALAGQPELLVLDEPTAALDRAGAVEVARLLATLDERVTIVITTHDPVLIATAVDRLDLGAAGPALATGGMG